MSAYEGGRGAGLLTFAVAIVSLLGFLNMLYGITAIINSHVFTAHAHYVFGNLRAWGWITLIAGLLQLAVAAGLAVGNQLARWLAVVIVGLNAIGQMLALPSYPFWSLMIFAVDVVAFYGLCAYGGRRPAHG